VDRQAGAPQELGSIEEIDDRVRQARELTKCCNHVFAAGGLGLAERYRRGELNLAARCIFSDAPQDGFVLSAIRENDFSLEDFTSSMIDKKALRDDIDVDKPAVLPHNVELVKLNEQRISSRIRFQRFDDRAWGGGQPLYKFFRPITPRKEGGFVSGDREIRIFWFTCAVALGQGRSKDVQAASNGVDISPELDIERERERLFFDRYHNVVSGWRWRLFDDDFDVVSEPPLDPFDEGWQLGFGPAYTCGGVQKVRLHG